MLGIVINWLILIAFTEIYLFLYILKNRLSYGHLFKYRNFNLCLYFTPIQIALTPTAAINVYKARFFHLSDSILSEDLKYLTEFSNKPLDLCHKYNSQWKNTENLEYLKLKISVLKFIYLLQ